MSATDDTTQAASLADAVLTAEAERQAAHEDEEILFAYRYLAREEGIFCEPASAAAMAGVFKLLREGRLEPESTVVLTLTGHGLKDPATAERVAELPPPVPARLEAVAAAAGLL